MKRGTGWDRDTKYINRVISYNAKKLAGTNGFTRSDREDIEQELYLDLLRRLPNFNRKLSSRRTFISHVVENHVRTLIEHQKAAKRDYRKTACSLDETLNPHDADSGCRHEKCSTDEGEYSLISRLLTAEQRRDLRIDIRFLLTRLSPEHREICLLLMEGERRVTVARRLGIPRSNLYGRIAVLRDRMHREGFSSRN